jgi:hypothetical protein
MAWVRKGGSRNTCGVLVRSKAGPVSYIPQVVR